MTDLSDFDIRHLEMLLEHDGWQVLRRILEGEKDRRTVAWGKRLMAGGDVEMEKVHYWRGFYAGCEAVLESPVKVLAARQREEETLVV